ncbi:MAG: acyltransferase [Actinomycetota bacterium]|nr:acyltransferase [Actinomycetota bacterium]
MPDRRTPSAGTSGEQPSASPLPAPAAGQLPAPAGNVGDGGRYGYLRRLRGASGVYFRLRRRYIMLRHRNVRLAEGVRVAGQFRVSRRVHVYIGENTRLTKGVSIDGHGTVTVGRDTLLNGCSIGCWTSVTIGDNCLVGTASIFDTDFHNLEPELRHAAPGPRVTSPVVIEDNVWLGGQAAVMKGVTIGADSVIGRATMVRRSVPPRSVVIGNPQQIVKTLAEPGASRPNIDAQEPSAAGFAASDLDGDGSSVDESPSV